MTTGAPGVFIDHTAEPFGEAVIGTLPENLEGSGRADDWIVVNAIFSADLSHLVGHASAAGHAVHDALGAFEHTMENTLATAHLPQNVHVDRAVAAGEFVSNLCLVDAALDGIGNELFVPVTSTLAVIDLIDHLAVFAREVGIDAFAIGNSNALAAFHQRKCFTSGNSNSVKRFHTLSRPVSQPS